jgi:excisionase family DNA binding protein
MAQLMQVRQVARTLGVHENTVRRWEERGLLHAVRLPSGVRRFRPEDVEAVREQMFSGFAPLHANDDVVPVRAHSVD